MANIMTDFFLPYGIFILFCVIVGINAIVWNSYRERIKLKLSVIIGLGLILAITLFYSILTLRDSRVQIIVISILLGSVLSVPICFFSRKCLCKRIEGTTIHCKEGIRLIDLLWFLPLLLFLDSNYGQKIVDVGWPILSVLFAICIERVFILHYVIKLEKKLAASITQHWNNDEQD